jgi:hypothetical protein
VVEAECSAGSQTGEKGSERETAQRDLVTCSRSHSRWRSQACSQSLGCVFQDPETKLGGSSDLVPASCMRKRQLSLPSLKPGGQTKPFA